MTACARHSRSITAAVLGSLVIALSTAGAAPSDRDRYDRHVGKFALREGAAKLDPRRMCICTNGDPETDNTPGYLYFVPRPAAPNNSTVFCFVPEFDDAGDLTATTSCEDFVPLVR